MAKTTNSGEWDEFGSGKSTSKGSSTDKRLTQVEDDKKAALSDIEKTYSGMINASDGYYYNQIQAVKDWGDKQAELQQAQSDFAIQKIEQQKAQAKQDYTKEQSGAYTDWQKQSNAYGANAEQMAAQGMMNTGFSESSRVSMYNTYQNRVAMARQSFERAVLDYNNDITEARLQNNSIKAEIAFQTLQKRLELSLAGFQYKNTLILEQAKTKREAEQMYHSQYMDVLQQINQETALAESKRHNEAIEKAQAAQLAEEKRQFNILHPTTSGGKGIPLSKYTGYSKGGATSNKPKSGSTKSNEETTKTDKPKSSTKKNSGEIEVDADNLIALGYAGRSEEYIADLVDRGILIPYEENGKIKFIKGPFSNGPLPDFSKYLG